MSKATFEVYEDTAGQWRWRLVHDNGNILADSGEGYSSKQKCTQGLESVKQNAAEAAVETADE
ncbi:MAG: HVO_2922 family protein [Halohasta sp.]